MISFKFKALREYDDKLTTHANSLQGYILRKCTSSTCINLSFKLDQTRNNCKIFTFTLASEFSIIIANITFATTETIAQLQCMQQNDLFKIVHVLKFTLTFEEMLIRQRVIAFNLIDAKQRDLSILISR